MTIYRDRKSKDKNAVKTQKVVTLEIELESCVNEILEKLEEASRRI